MLKGLLSTYSKWFFLLLVLIHAEITFAQVDASLFIPRSSPFWNNLSQFSVAAAKDIGLKLTVYNAKNSTETLLAQVQQAIDAKTQAILFVNYGGVGETILNLAERHKIPSLLINTKLNDRSLKPRVDYHYWIGSITPEFNKKDHDKSLGLGGPFFDGAQAVIMIYDYLNGHDFSDEGVTFASSMKVTEEKELSILKRILENAHIVDYKGLSKAHSPNLKKYQFSPTSILTKVKISLNSEEQRWLAEHPRLSVGIMSAWPPISFLNTETREPEGIDADIIHEINKYLKQPLTVIPADWNTIYGKAKKKELDIIMGITPKPFRKEFFNFTTPYLSVPHIIVTKKNIGSFIRDELDLSHKTLALEKSFVNVEYFKKNYPDVVLKLYDNTLDALEAVSRGDAYAYAGSRIVVLYLIDKYLLSNLKINGKLSKKATDNAIGVRKDYPILRGILQKVLNNIGERGLQQITKHWLNSSTLENKQAIIGLTQQEKLWIKNHKDIDIGVDGNWPPIDFMENHKFYGITADYLKEISRLVGFHFIPHKSNSFKEMLAKVMSGELKVGASISYKKQRAEKLLFSKPFFEVKKVIITKKQTSDISNIKSLLGKNIAIEDGFLTMTQLQERYPKINLIPMKSTLDALKAVSFGKADAYVGNQAVAAWLSQKNQLSNLRVVGDPNLGSGPQNFAVSKTAPDWAPLIGILDKALASISPEKKFAIENRWLGQVKKSSKQLPVLNLTIKEKKWLQEHKEITLGVDAAWEPLEFINSVGEYKGISADFMAYFSEQLGVKFKAPEKLAWSEVVDNLKKKQFDLAPLIAKTDNRTNFLNFTKPYLNFPAVIFNRKGNVLLNGLSGLNGKKLGVVQGYAYSELIAHDFPDIQQIFMASTKDGLKALSTGEVDAYIDMLAVGGYQMVNSGLTNLQVAASVPYVEGSLFRMGVRKDWPELVGILNKAISQLSEEHKNAILKKWLVVKFQQKTDYTLLFWVLGVAFLIFVLLSLRAREMKKINNQLQAANEAVEKSSQFKSQFLANMSHEIRTPMNAIVGIGHLLSSTQLSHKQMGYIKTLQNSANSLLCLIDDILDFSKIESGHLKVEIIEFNLETLLRDLSDITTHKIADKKLEFIYRLGADIPLHLKGDPFRVNQILINLVTNAIKFTEHGHVILNIDAIKSTHDKVWLRFEVSDTGIGINTDKLDCLFAAFEQEDNSTTRKYGGTGLGLSICRQLTELMGGNIGVTSIKGVGSQFYFNLPFDIVESKQKMIAMPEPNLLGLNVLLVDDNQQALEILSEMMRSMSFNVTIASSGEEALQQLTHSELEFDLILLDWRMPNMSGEETLEKIRHLLPEDKCPLVVMMTAYGRDAIEHEIDQLPLDGFLVKPITPSLLFDVIMEGQNQSKKIHKDSAKNKDSEALKVDALTGQILLAEDNLINQQVAREILQQMGLDVWICGNGVEVINLLNKKQPDLILMDIQMPEMDGYEATRLIKNNPKTSHIPIIAMTANAMAEDVEKSIESGMQAHISKPVDPAILFKTLSRYLKKPVEPVIDKDAVSHQNETQWPDKMPGLNIKKGIKQVGGNELFYHKLIKDFLKNHGDFSASIVQNIKDNELEKAARKTHTIKGVAGNIGAYRLQQVASDLDKSLKAKERINNELLQSLSDSCHELCGSLKALINRDEIKATELISDKSSQTDINNLLHALQLNDAQSYELLLEAKAFIMDKLGLSDFETLELLIHDFDHEEALEYLTTRLNEV